MNAREFSLKYGFSGAWLPSVLKKHYDELEKEGLLGKVVERVQKGKRFFWEIKDEQALKEWLQKKGYKLP